MASRATWGLIGLIVYGRFMAVWTVLKFIVLILQTIVVLIYRLGWFGWMFAFDRERVHQPPPWAGTFYTATVEFSDGREMNCCDQGHETMEEAEECARIKIAGSR